MSKIEQLEEELESFAICACFYTDEEQQIAIDIIRALAGKPSPYSKDVIKLVQKIRAEYRKNGPPDLSQMGVELVKLHY